jgi:integrase
LYFGAPALSIKVVINLVCAASPVSPDGFFALCGASAATAKGSARRKPRRQSLILFLLFSKKHQTKAEIAQQMQFAKSIWLHDQQNRIPLQIPEKLGQKYPEYQFSWFWAWLFPARNTCSHPRTRQIVRFHMHEANVQRAIKTARRKLGIMVLPHELRHGYATHALEQGANPRAIQEVMGHKSIETTMKYLHADSLSVRSPLDLVMGGQLQCTIPKDSLHDSK